MNPYETLERHVRHCLRLWPQHPSGVAKRLSERHAWQRGRPRADAFSAAATGPFLTVSGSNHPCILPDGLWLNFGGTARDPFVDVVAIEACGLLQKLLDKRPRFTPTAHSLLAVCPVPWLLAAFLPNDPSPRWQVTGVMRREPAQPLVLPVRDIRVICGLKHRHDDGFVRHNMPHGDECAPTDGLTAEDGDKDPGLQAMLSHATASAQFLVTAPRH